MSETRFHPAHPGCGIPPVTGVTLARRRDPFLARSPSTQSEGVKRIVPLRSGERREVSSGLSIHSSERAHVFDVIDEGEQILVIVEMPGVSILDIRIVLKNGETLEVSCSNRDFVYWDVVTLPQRVDPQFSQEEHNGVVTLTFKAIH